MQLGLGGELFQQASREAERTSGKSYQVDLTTVGVVMMNPPFTKTERGIRQYVNMDRYQSITGGAVGLWGHFLALANQFVEPGGIVAAVLPINFLRGTESRLVRELTFTDWTPLYILKPTVNYGFSEWSEYRDIIFIAQKEAPAPNHQVRFALVKQDLTRLDTEAAHHTATRIQALPSLRSADLDIQSFGIDALRERFSNLMWFCGVSSFAHRDRLLSFVERFAGRLQRFPAGYFREGYRPVPQGVSKFLFLTRKHRSIACAACLPALRLRGRRAHDHRPFTARRTLQPRAFSTGAEPANRCRSEAPKHRRTLGLHCRAALSRTRAGCTRERFSQPQCSFAPRLLGERTARARKGPNPPHGCPPHQSIFTTHISHCVLLRYTDFPKQCLECSC